MVKVSFSASDYLRHVADEADVILRNRYYEQNPSLSEDGAALLARPGLKLWATVGDGPIRGIHSEPGAFGGDLFVASGPDLFRINNLGEATLLYSDLFNPDVGVVNMAITQAIGDDPDHLFVADGRNLFVYDGTDYDPVTTPEDIGIFDVVTIASYVICIPVQEDEFIGRFYWVEPGEITIDSNNHATAESYPDRLLGVRRFGDQFWLPGERSTEVWYPTGDATAPMSRLQGVVFDRGAWEGTVVAIKETLIIVDADGGVFAIRGGSPQRISNPGIEEQIRKAIQLHSSSGL